MATLEHLNITVSDPRRTADLLSTLFDWTVRWEGDAIDKGYTIHLGTQDQYLALYAPSGKTLSAGHTYTRAGGLNHVGVVVDDLEAVEARVRAANLEPYNFGDYEPGRRFYFRDADHIEYEVVSYGDKK